MKYYSIIYNQSNFDSFIKNARTNVYAKDDTILKVKIAIDEGIANSINPDN